MPELKNKNPKIDNKKIIISLLILIVLILGIISFLKTTNENPTLEVYVPTPEASMEVGNTGFLEETETIETVNPDALQNPVRPLDMPIPKDIFHTAGSIITIQANSVIIRGNGTNFDDQRKRDLTVVIDENTKINGVKGDLEYFKTNLKLGDEISIEAACNIHGKTEFLAKYINTINND